MCKSSFAASYWTMERFFFAAAWLPPLPLAMVVLVTDTEFVDVGNLIAFEES